MVKLTIEARIFLTFFIISSIYIHWTGWTENSLFDLTRSIVDKGTSSIDDYYNNTGDRSLVNGHYYSNKAPGGAFIATPVYFAWKAVYNALPSPIFQEQPKPLESLHMISNVPIVVDMNLDIFTRLSMILVTFISIFFYASSTILVYRISSYFTRNKIHIFLTAVIFALGTLAFAYSKTFTTNIMGMFFPLLSFYLLTEFKFKKNEKFIILSGLATGFGVVVDYWILLLAPAFLFYLIAITKKRLYNILQFLIAFSFGISPLLIYNYLILGNPFDLVFRYQDPAIWTSAGSLGFNFDLLNPSIILQLLIFPYRGLFFYSPILILSLIGLFLMYKRHKIEALIIAYIFLIMLFANSIYWYWWSGYTFGQRFLLPVVPFLVIPILFLIDRNLKVVLLLFTISILINITGLQQWEEKISSVSGKGVDEQYKDKITSFSFFKNPLFDHYIPLTLEYGPRSRLLESLVNKDLEIRDFIFSPAGKTPQREVYLFLLEPLGFVTLKINWLALFIALILASVIWKNELQKIFGRKLKWLWVLYVLVFFIFFIGITRVKYETNWHAEEAFDAGTFRWMSQNATIILYEPTDSLARISFGAWGYQKNRTMNLFVNGQKFTFNIVSDGQGVSTPLLQLNKSLNLLRFESEEGCDSEQYDIRCRSFGITNIKAFTLEQILSVPLFDTNWYSEEKADNRTFRWMSQNATISIYERSPKSAKLAFTVSTYGKKQLNLDLNQKEVDSYEITASTEIVTPILELQTSNILLFNSVEGCEIPALVELVNDTRCLSFAVSNFKIIPIENIYNEVLFGSNWYTIEKGGIEEFRWMSQNSTLFIYNPIKEDKRLFFEIESYRVQRTLQVSINNQTIERSIEPNFKIISVPIAVESGENRISFYSKEGCEIPAEVKISNDRRCLSFRIKNLKIR